MHTSQCTENKPDIQDVHQIKFALACLTSRSVPRAVHTDCFRSGSSWKLLLSHPIFSVTFCHTNPTARPPSLQESALRSLFLLHSSSIFNILCRAHPQSLLYTCPNHLIFLTLKTAKLSSTELTKWLSWSHGIHHGTLHHLVNLSFHPCYHPSAKNHPWHSAPPTPPCLQSLFHPSFAVCMDFSGCSWVF